MRSDVQAIFKETPHDKQVMMFSATLAKEIRAVCKKFMNKVLTVTISPDRTQKVAAWHAGTRCGGDTAVVVGRLPDAIAQVAAVVAPRRVEQCCAWLSCQAG